MSTTEIQGARSSKRRTAHLRVAVVMGGTSGEREVSLVSGRSVVQALERCVLSNALAEVRALEIDASGRWLCPGGAADAAGALAACRDIDVFFLALHGGEGENGTIQGLFESCGRRYTGSPVAASAICMDKAAARALAQSAGLRVAPGRLVDARAFALGRAAELERARTLADASGGWFVKPRRGGSSVNTHFAADASQLERALASVIASGDDALVEACVRGIEVSCGVLDPRGGEPRALPPIEIQPSGERFFDYEQKYSESGAREVCPAPSLAPASLLRVQEAALRLHALCGCAGYSRTDFIVPAAGDPVLLEINTLPGLTPRSLLPQEAAAVGIAYDELCLGLVECAAGGGQG